MDSGKVAVDARRAASHVVKALTWGLVAIAALAWSSGARAQSCDFVPVGATAATGPAGTQVSFTLRAEVACTPTVDIVLAITADTTGGAAIVPPTAPTLVLDTDYTFTVALGPLANGTGTVQASCVPTFCTPGSLVFTFNTDATVVRLLTAVDGGDQTVLPNVAFPTPLQANATDNGLNAVGVPVSWTVTSGSATLSAATSNTDNFGNASVTATAGNTPGPVTITAVRQDDATAIAVFNLTVDALGTLDVIGGDGQTLAAGATSAPLQVELRDAAGNPIAGSPVAWTASAGTLGAATTLTNGAGVASNTVTVASAGAVDVTASSPLAAAPAVFQLNGALRNLAGLSRTQRAVAEAIDTFCPALAALPTPTAQQADLLARCRELGAAAGLDPAATVDALDQLMAGVALTQANAALSAVQSQFQNLKTRIAALRSGTGGTRFGGLALNTPAGPISLGTLSSAFGADGEATEVGADFSRWGFFAAGTIGRGESDGGSVDPAFDYDVEGLTAGLDYRRSDRWVIGGSLGYTRQDTDLPGDRGGLDTTGWSVSAYSTYYQADSWYLDSVLTWGRNDYEMLRRIQYTLPLAGGGSTSIDQTAIADASGDLFATAFTFGRDFNRGAFGVGPYGRLMYTRLGFDEIREQTVAGAPGSGLGLAIESRDLTSLASVLGTKFTWTHGTNWGVLMPHLQLEWEHEFRDDPQAMEARFLNDPLATPMLVTGDPLDTDYFRLGLGLSMVLTGGRSGFFYYERLAGRDGESQWNLALGLRMEF
ncbi:MAG TPA: autotransporter domain-containing protein [Arenimonas sp.]|uniref:autotransporter domain-containing protein n=1 Tax=Arenimonas sp. TaxID=1872635 RepID=UPI002D802727|nr:autotransporter domain-containing protein [Arenimonas sp.]HEU0154379.1 autotransporter domain-containing protein [Arenimonas sp.]